MCTTISNINITSHLYPIYISIPHCVHTLSQQLLHGSCLINIFAKTIIPFCSRIECEQASSLRGSTRLSSIVNFNVCIVVSCHACVYCLSCLARVYCSCHVLSLFYRIVLSLVYCIVTYLNQFLGVLFCVIYSYAHVSFVRELLYVLLQFTFV